MVGSKEFILPPQKCKLFGAMNLYPYQTNLQDALLRSFAAGHKHTVLQLATGGGKTVIFCSTIYRSITKGKKALIITDRTELLTQAGGTLSKFGLKAYKLDRNAKNPHSGDKLAVCMVETLSRRLNGSEGWYYAQWLQSFDMIIIDEAHKRCFDKLFQFFSPITYVVGATATPVRMGRKSPLKDFYTDMVCGPQISNLIEMGKLSTCLPFKAKKKTNFDGVGMKNGDYDDDDVAKAFSAQATYKSVVAQWLEKSAGKKTIIFCSNIESSLELMNEFVSRGVADIRHIDSNNTNDSERKQILKWFDSNAGAILCNVGILTTGFDCPSIEVVVIYRKTRSLSLYLQMVGRGGRIIEGIKNTFMLFDFGGCYEELGQWMDDRKWSLEPPKKQKKKGASPMKECPECDLLVAPSVRKCPQCGHEFEFEKAQKVDVELVPMESVSVKYGLNLERDGKGAIIGKVSNALDTDWQEAIKDMVRIAKAGLVKPFAFLYRMKSVEQAEFFGKLMGYRHGWLTHHLDKIGTHKPQ